MISKRLRYEILRRDAHRCRYCGATAAEGELTVDHVAPVALGGSDEPENLVCACRDCNAGKSSVAPDSPIVENVADDALRWAAAMESAAETQRTERDAVLVRLTAFEKEWERWTGYSGKPVPIPQSWPRSVERFIENGLSDPELADLIDIAMSSRCDTKETFTYFCGCAWRKIKERQEIARGLLETDEAA